MTEEIIIDGVDVAGCEHYTTMEDCDGIHDLCEQLDDYCSIKKNCYYKQLKRLEQENRELKAYKDVNEDFKKAWDELNKKYTEVLKLAKLNADSNEYCLRKLEKENKALKSLNKTICEDCSKEIKVYWNALEEIKHGIMHIPPFDEQSAQMIESLLKLINEVLND